MLKINRFLDPFLCGFQWYRRLRGGKWVGYYIDDPVYSFIWRRWINHIDDNGERLCLERGQGTIEDYTKGSGKHE